MFYECVCAHRDATYTHPGIQMCAEDVHCLLIDVLSN